MTKTKIIVLILGLLHPLYPTIASAQATSTIPTQLRNGSLPLVSPDGSHIVFFSNRDGSDDMYVIASDGTGEARITHTPVHESFAGWSADSKSVAFSVFQDEVSVIHAVDIDGKTSGRSPVCPDATR